MVRKIVNQKQPETISILNHERSSKHQIHLEKIQREEEKLGHVKSTLSSMQNKILEAIMEKGASNWLTAIPIKEHGFYLNKQEFWDSVKIRYGIPLSRLPSKCACGENFNVEHAFDCKKGGFVL